MPGLYKTKISPVLQDWVNGIKLKINMPFMALKK